MTAVRERVAALGFVLALGPRTDRPRSVLVAAVAILQQATGVGLAVLLGLVVEVTANRSVSGVVVVSGCAALFVVLTQGTFIAGYFTRLRLREEAQQYVETRFIDVVGTTPTVELHERPAWRDRTAAVRAAREDIGQSFDTAMVLAGAVLLLVTSGVLLASIVPVLAVLPLFAVPALLATQRAENKRGEAVRDALSRTRLAGHLFSVATTAPTGREVRLFGLARELVRRHREQWDRGGRDVAVAEGRARVLVALAWLLFVLAYGAAMALIVRAALAGDATLGLIVAAIAVMAQISGQVQILLSWVFWVLEAVRGAGAYLDVVRQGEQEKREIVPDAPAAVPGRLTGGITIEGLGFRYEGRAEPSLRDVGVHLPAGATVALVGENGAGKSTLVKLLAGLYRPTGGRILVDGTDLARLEPDAWRGRVTAAFQDPARIELSVRDAVGIGDVANRADPDRVADAVRRAGGEAIVASLPDGLDTRLGRRSWDGTELSGGQWQTMANARAAMRREPLLRLLDEPTASLDAQAEERLFQRFAELDRLDGGVTILVTHRFTTARAADLIVVLADGRVAEVGDHDTLRRAGGVYAELFTLQARYFA
ncbi:ABC transporter ATP-binding protein [Amycolatopsis sp. A133]|uniref:ABC transporter ATP-binding protein n=1 Tax=Amycolatopsis sp. A133 TaxID=3064472 RepID=UPI0027F0DDEE|nr:ABC transporter ATP-binding protein [Amycolatopsis sp. A133]MDQ7803465.1 ABC transporter ATP-binding protein [Amycolatopsis sp. A133]